MGYLKIGRNWRIRTVFIEKCLSKTETQPVYLLSGEYSTEVGQVEMEPMRVANPSGGGGGFVRAICPLLSPVRRSPAIWPQHCGLLRQNVGGQLDQGVNFDLPCLLRLGPNGGHKLQRAHAALAGVTKPFDGVKTGSSPKSDFGHGHCLSPQCHFLFEGLAVLAVEAR